MRTLLMAMLVFCAAGPAFALTPMGPPVATLELGKFAAGFGYSNSQGDVKVTVLEDSYTLKDVELDTYMANLVFGIAEDLELQIDLGALSYEDEDLSSSGDFAGGLVLRSTFAQTDKVKWGVASSVHWYQTKASTEYMGFKYREKATWTEIQIAIGPSYTEDRWCLYGGPFMHFIKGNVESSVAGFSVSGDFEEDSNFGGFVGARIEIAKNTEMGIEYQRTGSDDAVGVSILWRF